MKKSPKTDSNSQNSSKTSSTPVEPVENYVDNSEENPVENSQNHPENSKTADQTLAKITELTNDLQRTRADFENFRKQVEVQREQAKDAARYATVEKFLPLLDDLDRAMDAYAEQLAPLRKNLDKTLSSLGVAKIDSQPGTEFNPDFHDAISVLDEDGDLEVISETLRPGYLYEGSVLRPAMVKVSRVAAK